MWLLTGKRLQRLLKIGDHHSQNSVMYTQIYPMEECYLGLASGKFILETPVLLVPSTASDVRGDETAA